MKREQGKTLHVFVYDTVKVSDSYTQKGIQYNEVRKPVFLMSINQMIEALFAGVQNFARPPTAQFNFLTLSKSHFALLQVAFCVYKNTEVTF